MIGSKHKMVEDDPEMSAMDALLTKGAPAPEDSAEVEADGGGETDAASLLAKVRSDLDRLESMLA